MKKNELIRAPLANWILVLPFFAIFLLNNFAFNSPVKRLKISASFPLERFYFHHKKKVREFYLKHDTTHKNIKVKRVWNFLNFANTFSSCLDLLLLHRRRRDQSFFTGRRGRIYKTFTKLRKLYSFDSILTNHFPEQFFVFTPKTILRIFAGLI